MNKNIWTHKPIDRERAISFLEEILEQVKQNDLRGGVYFDLQPGHSIAGTVPKDHDWNPSLLARWATEDTIKVYGEKIR